MIARKLRFYRFGGAHDNRIYLAIACRYWHVRLEEMQQHLAQSKAQLLEIIDRIRDRPEGMDCSGSAERVMASIKGRKS